MPDLPPDIDAAPLDPDAVGRRSFPTVRRGLDPEAVRGFLDEVVTSLRVLRRREEALQAQLEDAERRAAAPVLDEETLTAAVGSETAKVLRAAHEAARDVIARAEVRSADLLAEATAVLGERTREAESEARAIAARSRAEAGALAESTKVECRTMVEEAREARRRILADLADRRRTLHVQLEQLRAGKDALAGVVEATARSVEDVRAKLVGSEAEARLAADRAAQIAGFEHDDMSLDALVEEALSVLAPRDEGRAGESEGDELEPADAQLSAVGNVQAEEPEVTAQPAAAGGAEPTDEPVAGSDGAEPPPGPVVPAAEAPREDLDGTDPDDEEPSEPERGSGDEHPAGEAAPSQPSSSVDDLFARLRAGRSGDASVAADEESGEASPAASEGGIAEARAVPVERGSGQDEAHDRADDESGVEADGAERKEVLARRDELLAPVLADLARILKRELRSDQNELLDSLRHLESGAEPGALVPGEATTVRLATATGTALVAAWRAGCLFAIPGGGGGRGEHSTQPAEAAQELAREVVASLRARLEGALSGAEDDGVAAEIVGAAYRQWRGERVEDLAGDYATRVFSLGVLARIGDGALVTWVVDDGEDHCPDCDDNALAGPQRAGDAFPTGQTHPPVHAGCRCVLVPTGV